MKEALSALIDAELKATEQAGVLQKVAEDPDLRAAWERYHVVRGVLREECIVTLRAGFSDRVAAQLAEQSERAGARKGHYLVRLALAASVTAVAALFGLHMAVMRDGGTAGPARITIASLPAPQPFIQRAHWRQARPWHNRLNAFLLEHPAGNSFTPPPRTHMRIATYDGELVPGTVP